MASSVAPRNWKDKIKEKWDNITKGPNDIRLYRGLELWNGMKVLLISSPNTDMAAASLCVSVGSMSDPKELPGLAHFVEHICLLRSENPQGNTFREIITENGGNCNAETHLDHTLFFFDIFPDKLKNALKNFVSICKPPNITQSIMESELNAVEAEHKSNLHDDGWRLNQLNKSTCNPSHPYNGFSTGNKKTLETTPKEKGIDVRNELLKFHKQWYSPNIMGLCVLGKEPLDELERIIVKLFGCLEDKNVTAPRWDKHPCDADSQGTMVTVVPVEDLRSLYLIFPIPEYNLYYKSVPKHYLSHLLCHQGLGSVFFELKKRGWCNSLERGIQDGARGFSFFQIKITLTERGIRHINSIVKVVFQYIQMIKNKGPQKYIFDELQITQELTFNYNNCTGEPYYCCEDLAPTLTEYPMEDILTAHHHLTEWRPDQIEELSNLLTPERMRLGVVGKKFEDKCTSIEQWYGTKYHLEKIPHKTIEDWKNPGLCDELHLPEPNNFIPDSFDLLPRDPESQKHPFIIKDTKFMRVWYKQDDEYLLPKLCTIIEFHSPLVYSDPLNCNMNTLFSMLFKDTLSEYAYAAELAGTSWQIGNSKSGLSLRIEGYDSKQHVLLEKIMECMTNFKVDKKRFNILKEVYVSSHRNFEAEQPYQHGIYNLENCLLEIVWTNEQLEESFRDVTVEKFEDFILRLLSSFHVECMFHGNINKARALDLAKLVENRLLKKESRQLQQCFQEREIQLEKGKHYMYEVDHTVHKDSCIVVYFQCGLQSTVNNVLLELLHQIILEPFFDTMRTKEQLGYHLYIYIQRRNGVQGLTLVVQSEDLVLVEAKINDFLLMIKSKLEAMPNKEFEDHCNTLKNKMQKKPDTIEEKTNIFWLEINSQQYNFNRPEVEAGALEKITKNQLIDFWNENFDVKSQQRLTIKVKSSAETIEQSSGTDVNETEIVKIEKMDEFKAGKKLFPRVVPYMNIPPLPNQIDNLSI